MLCLNCKGDVPSGARFCIVCGAPVQLACSSCGSANPVDACFCSRCGPLLDNPKSSFSPPIRGERRQLTVAFCDLVGSTPLSTRLDPEDLGAVIRGYQSTVAAIVKRFGGFI